MFVIKPFDSNEVISAIRMAGKLHKKKETI